MVTKQWNARQPHVDILQHCIFTQSNGNMGSEANNFYISHDESNRN